MCCETEEIDKELLVSLDSKNEKKGIDLLDLENCGQSAADRISGGNSTKAFDYPWSALLSYRGLSDEEHLCAGSLINTRYVLTAAHCIKIPGYRL